MKYRFIYSILMGGWLAFPVFISANGLPYSLENRDAPQSFILKVQEWEKERGGSWIPSYGSEMFRKSQEKSSESSDTDTRSYSDVLGPSFDMPDSVNGYSRWTDPWWGRRGEPEPMLKDVNRDPMKSP